jgi:hypothetical protein
MGKAKELVDAIDGEKVPKEKRPQFRTKVKGTMSDKAGSRHARNLTERSMRTIEDMVKQGNGKPNPKDPKSMALLSSAMFNLSEARRKLKEVKDSKKSYKG